MWGIKLKNNILKNQVRPNPSLYGLVLLALVIFISAAGLRRAYSELNLLREGELDYLQTYIRADDECWSNVVRYARNLNRFFIHHRDFDGAARNDAVTEDDMAEDVAFLTSVLTHELVRAVNRYMSSVFDEGQGVAGAQDARQAFEYEMAALGTSYLDVLGTAFFDAMNNRWQFQLSERVSNFTAVQNYLDSTREFAFFLHDSILDDTFTNIVPSDGDIDAYIEFYLAYSTYAIINLSDIFDTFNGIPLNESFTRAGISGFISMPLDQPLDSVVTRTVVQAHVSWLNSIEDARRVTNAYMGLTLIAVLTMTIITVKVLIPDFGGAWEGFLRGLSLYLHVPFLLKLIFVLYSFAFIADFIGGTATPSFLHLLPIYASIIVMMFSFILLIRTFSGHYQFSDELEARVVRKIIQGFGIMRRLRPVLLPVISITLALTSLASLVAGFFVLYSISARSLPADWPYILFGIGALGISLASCALLLMFTIYAESYYYIKIIAEGSPVTIPKQKGVLGKPLNVLNGLSEGLQLSLEEQLHAERTKTELITSVSHDLKTPLTSIINYVDLLKKSDIKDDTAKEYVDILENKSERLKVLIEDLFEAAKLTSGSMELLLSPVDIVQLLTQAIGELSDKFATNGIEIRFKPPEQKIIAMLDGQRMWRVFENLLNNIANYSPPDSRAYITVDVRDNEIEIVMKNVSMYPLDIDSNELFERFKRGDTARSTEGSGLGLSIAKDIVELHGGRVGISIDGDLFKVAILLKADDAQAELEP